MLRAILDHGPVARSNLARLTGLSAASVSNLTGGLLDVGLVREVPEAAGPPGFGRPHVPIDLETDRLGVFGVHVAVPHVSVALIDVRGSVVDRRIVPHDSPTPEDVVSVVARATRELGARHPERRLLGLGVGVGGWVDAEAGLVVEHPALGWRQEPLRDLLVAAIGLPTYVEGHGRGLLRAEQLVGQHAARARRSAVHLFVGHVVDVAFSFGGLVHEGPRSASGRIDWLRADDHGTVVERTRRVGRTVATLLDLFDPEVLVVAEPGFRTLPEARQALLAEVGEASHTRADAAGVVVPSSFADDALAMAGGGIVLDRLYADPTSVSRVSPLPT